MKVRDNMALAFENTLTPSPGYPSHSHQAGPLTAELNVAVVFTSIDATLAALKEAGTLASRLSGRITLLVPQIVPYPLPLTSPPVLLDWNERRFRVIATECPVETTVQIYLCRDRTETLLRALKPRSLVVVGGVKRWWPTPESRLVKKLHRAGHEVIFKEME